VRLLQENHFIGVPVLDLPGVISHPQMKARNAFQTINVPGFGDVPLPKAPFHFSETPTEIPPELSMLGQDNERVLGKYLGYTRERVAALTGSGVLAQDAMLAERRKRGASR